MPAAGTENLPPELREAWEHVLERWNDDDTHKRFIALCSVTGRLDCAGSTYRRVRDTQPARADDAEARIRAICELALQGLMHTRSSPQATGPRKIFYLALGVASTLILYALWVFL